jgi:hypothetical protein
VRRVRIQGPALARGGRQWNRASASRLPLALGVFPAAKANLVSYEGGADQPAFGVASAPLGQARIEPAKETPGIAVSIPRSAAQEAPQSLKESRTPTSIPARTRPPAHTTGTRSRE